MLTEKERKILELRRKGLRQIEIAKKLKISQPAVSSFESNAIKKITEAHATLDFIKNIGLKPEDLHVKKR